VRGDDEEGSQVTWKRALLTGAGAIAALAIAAGCSDNNNAGSEHPMSHTSAPATASAGAPNTPVGDAHNDADVMFAQHMIPHHQQAIEMSDMLLAKQGIDPRVTELAKQIKAAQGPEIQQMQGWLAQWGNPAMPSMPSGDMPGHGDMPGMTGMPMPTTSAMPGMSGMMSEQDMTALQNAQAVEAGKLFLTQMIAHHEGAITMAQNEIKGGQYAAAVELARSIVTAQQKEIETMKGILATL
jgi:uncharacterized protein (DUF305 family)